MKVKIDIRKSAQENAAAHFELAKSLAKKAEGVKKAILETEKKLAETSSGKKVQKAPKMKRKKEWYEKYHWFFTSGKKLVVAGRDAKQNDQLVLSVMKENDLFFHADIQGAPATILFDGKSSSEQEKKEAAQFAASHSSAWKIGAAAVDVYFVQKEQISKAAQGGYIGKGGFAISGRREWIRAVALGMAVVAQDGKAVCLPICHPEAKNGVAIAPGQTEKGKAAEVIASMIGVEKEEVLLALPAGKFSIKGENV
ncbi:MAG: NFACT RNA binding domain-containing protein [Candidatus Anstonellaceae archaeon]